MQNVPNNCHSAKKVPQHRRHHGATSIHGLQMTSGMGSGVLLNLSLKQLCPSKTPNDGEKQQENDFPGKTICVNVAALIFVQYLLTHSPDNVIKTVQIRNLRQSQWDIASSYFMTPEHSLFNPGTKYVHFATCIYILRERASKMFAKSNFNYAIIVVRMSLNQLGIQLDFLLVNRKTGFDSFVLSFELYLVSTEFVKSTKIIQTGDNSYVPPSLFWNSLKYNPIIHISHIFSLRQILWMQTVMKLSMTFLCGEL